MWTREELKNRAKKVLKGNYWKAFLVSIVILLAGGEGVGGSSSGGRSGYNYYHDHGYFLPFDINFGNFAFFIIITTIIAILSFVCLRAFLGYPLEVGGRKFFIKSALYQDTSGCFRYAFDRENYMGIVKTMFLKGVQNFLWFLLFIIPGIVKRYAYSMVPYILAENPNIDSHEAIERSIEMTNGHKFDMFVLDLSFFGWYFLGALLFGIGTFFVMPYENATKAELYLVLKQNRLGEMDFNQDYQ